LDIVKSCPRCQRIQSEWPLSGRLACQRDSILPVTLVRAGIGDRIEAGAAALDMTSIRQDVVGRMKT
jgi:hypothetical protein